MFPYPFYISTYSSKQGREGVLLAHLRSPPGASLLGRWLGPGRSGAELELFFMSGFMPSNILSRKKKKEGTGKAGTINPETNGNICAWSKLKVLSMTKSSRGTRVHVSDETTDPPCITNRPRIPWCKLNHLSCVAVYDKVFAWSWWSDRRQRYSKVYLVHIQCFQ